MRSLPILVLGSALLLASPLCGAQSQRTPPAGGGGGPDPRTMQQLAAAQAEAATAKQQLADLQKELDKAKAERDALKAKIASSDADRGRDTARVESVTRELEQARDQIASLTKSRRDDAVALRAAEADRSALQGKLGAASSDYETCVNHNTELLTLTRDALARYEKMGSLARLDPFTRIARARAENLADEYRDRAAKLAVKPSTPSSAGSPP